MRVLHIDTFARLSAKATHETQSFSTELRKTKKVPTNICHKPLLSQLEFPQSTLKKVDDFN